VRLTLRDAMAILGPRTERLEESLMEIPGKPGPRESLLEHLSSANATAGYAVGIVVGLHMAGKTELIPRSNQCGVRASRPGPRHPG
jgi:hypothetical protein